MSLDSFKVKYGLTVGEDAVTIDSTTGNIVSTGTVSINNDLTIGGTGYIHSSSGLVATLSGNDATFDNNVTIGGNLTVNGTTTTVNSNTINLADNIITLNSDWVGAPSQNAGIEVNRGTGTTSAINWNETTGKWEQNRAGTTTVIPATTNELTESGNLYYTDSRARASLSAGTGVTYNAATGVISIGQAVATTSNVQFQDITQSRRLIYGAVRDSTTNSNGDIWSFSSGSGTGYRGITLDNSTDTTKRPGLVLRGYGGSLTSSLPRSSILFDNSRGSAASPTAVQQFDAIGEILAAGRTSTGWVGDLVASVPFAQKFYAAENWVSTTNVGTGWLLTCQPTATNFTTSSLISVIDASAQQMALRADTMAVSSGKTTTFVATGCSVSGTTLTIGTVTSGTITVGTSIQVVGGLFQACYITANISGSGNGSTWTLSQSQSTLSSLTAVGYKGAFGYGTNLTTVDILQPLKLYNGTVTTRDNTLTLNNNSGTNMITMGSTGRFKVYDPNNTANSISLDNPTSGGDNNLTLNFNLRNDNSGSAANQIPVFNFTNYRYNSGSSVYVPTQANDILGGFKFNGQYSSTGSSSIGVPTQIQAVATETWTSTAQGTKVVVSVNKTGTTTSVAAISASSDSVTLGSPLVLPSYTAATLRTMTGAAGWMASVLDSNGRMAYWDTHNNWWAYVKDDSAV